MNSPTPRWSEGAAPRSVPRRLLPALLAAALLLGGTTLAVLAADRPAVPEQFSAPDTQPETRPAPPPETRPAPPETRPAPPERPGRPARGTRRGAAATQPTTATAPASTAPGTTTEAATTQATPSSDRYLAVINGDVYTVTGPVLESATVLCRNGRIVGLGRGVALPHGCEVIDAAGKRVYPGLVAAGAGGLHGPSPVEDTTDVFSLSMNIASAVGITTALAGNAVAKVTYGSVEDMVLAQPAFVELSYRSDRPLERAQLRADLERVRRYLRELALYEQEKRTRPDAKEPDKSWLRDKFENYRKLLAREQRATVTASRAQDLLDLARLAEDFGFDLTIRGAVEGWTVAPQLARARVGVVITARVNVPPNEDTQRQTGSTIENARILFDHGIPVAVTPPTSTVVTWGVGGRDLTNLNMEAAYTVRGGLRNDDAVRTITIDAARVLGVERRVGSIEIGKDADLIVVDGDLLHYMTHVHYTIVNGRLAYEKSKDTLFAHIRPDGKHEVPDFDDQWPRRLEWRE